MILSPRQAQSLLDVLGLSEHLWADLGPTLTCYEADVVEQFLCDFGHQDKAVLMLERHAASDDDPEDKHHLETP